MIQPDMPDMNDPAEFLKKIWGAMPASLADVPGIVMPSLSIEEIDKQIADLKAVEGWLEMNRNMLRSTIQALEVQKATVENMNAMSDTAGDEKKPKNNVDAAAWWNELQAQFRQAVETAATQSMPVSPAKKSATRASKAPSKKAPVTSTVKKTAAKKTAKKTVQKKASAKR